MIRLGGISRQRDAGQALWAVALKSTIHTDLLESQVSKHILSPRHIGDVQSTKETYHSSDDS